VKAEPTTRRLSIAQALDRLTPSKPSTIGGRTSDHQTTEPSDQLQPVLNAFGLKFQKPVLRTLGCSARPPQIGCG